MVADSWVIDATCTAVAVRRKRNYAFQDRSQQIFQRDFSLGSLRFPLFFFNWT